MHIPDNNSCPRGESGFVLWEPFVSEVHIHNKEPDTAEDPDLLHGPRGNFCIIKGGMASRLGKGVSQPRGVGTGLERRPADSINILAQDTSQPGVRFDTHRRYVLAGALSLRGAWLYG
jgi:hypothetical protein